MKPGMKDAEMGYAFLKDKAYDSAIMYYEKSLDQFKKSNNQIEYIRALTSLAYLHKKLGQYEKSLEYSFEGLALIDSVSRERASFLNSIASIFSQIGEYRKSLSYHFQALEARIALEDNKRIGMSYNNLGNVYNKLDLRDSAIYYFSKSIEIKKSNQDISGLSTTLNNLGLAYLHEEDLDNAKRSFFEALVLKRDVGDSEGMANTYNNLARTLILEDNLQKAKSFLDSSYFLQSNLGNLYLHREYLDILSSYHKKMNAPLYEAQTLRKYILINDSLLNQEKAKALFEMQTKYDANEKDIQIDLLKNTEALQLAEINYQKQALIILLVAVTMFLVLIIVLVMLYKSKIRANNKIRNLHMEMQHRTKNNLQLLSNVFKLQSQSTSDLEAVSTLKSSESRINAMTIVHQQLFAKSDNSKIDMHQYLSDLCQAIEYSFHPVSGDLEIKLIADHISLEVDKVVYIGLMVNELMTNALKHAFTGVNNPIINVSLKLENQTLILQVSDNGIGIIDDQDEPTSFGFGLINILSNQLKASSKKFNQGGAVFQFFIPLN